MQTLDHPPPRTVVIVSGDRSLAYMIAALRMRRYEVILISPSGTHPSLTNQASLNLYWTTVDTTDMDDPPGRGPSPHPPPSHHHLPSSSSPSLPLSSTSDPKTNFSPKAQGIDPPPIVEPRPPSYESGRFNIFGDLGGSFPSPSVSHSMFGLEPLFPRSQPPASAPPSTVYSSLDSNGFGELPLSAKGKQRAFSITKPEGTAPQTQWTANMPEEPCSAGMAEGCFTNMRHSSAKLNAPLTTGSSTRSSSSWQDSTFSVIQFPLSSAPTSAEPVKNSPRAGKESQVPNPFRPATTLLLPSQKAPPPKETTLNTQAGPNSIPSHKYVTVPPHFRVLVETLRQHGGSHVKHTLPTLLLARDPQVYQNAGVHKYKGYIAAAVEAGLVREVRTTNCQYLCISLTEEYE